MTKLKEFLDFVEKETIGSPCSCYSELVDVETACVPCEKEDCAFKFLLNLLEK